MVALLISYKAKQEQAVSDYSCNRGNVDVKGIVYGHLLCC